MNDYLVFNYDFINRLDYFSNIVADMVVVKMDLPEVNYISKDKYFKFPIFDGGSYVLMHYNCLSDESSIIFRDGIYIYPLAFYEKMNKF